MNFKTFYYCLIAIIAMLAGTYGNDLLKNKNEQGSSKMVANDICNTDGINPTSTNINPSESFQNPNINDNECVSSVNHGSNNFDTGKEAEINTTSMDDELNFSLEDVESENDLANDGRTKLESITAEMEIINTTNFNEGNVLNSLQGESKVENDLSENKKDKILQNSDSESPSEEQLDICIPNIRAVSTFIEDLRGKLIHSDKCSMSQKEITDYFTELYQEIRDCGGLVAGDRPSATEIEEIVQQRRIRAFSFHSEKYVERDIRSIYNSKFAQRPTYIFCSLKAYGISAEDVVAAFKKSNKDLILSEAKLIDWEDYIEYLSERNDVKHKSGCPNSIINPTQEEYYRFRKARIEEFHQFANCEPDEEDIKKFIEITKASAKASDLLNCNCNLSNKEHEAYNEAKKEKLKLSLLKEQSDSKNLNLSDDLGHEKDGIDINAVDN